MAAAVGGGRPEFPHFRGTRLGRRQAAPLEYGCSILGELHTSTNVSNCRAISVASQYCRFGQLCRGSKEAAQMR